MPQMFYLLSKMGISDSYSRSLSNTVTRLLFLNKLKSLILAGNREWNLEGRDLHERQICSASINTVLHPSGNEAYSCATNVIVIGGFNRIKTLLI